MKRVFIFAVCSALVSSVIAQENAGGKLKLSRPVSSGPPQPTPVDKLPMFAICQVGSGLSQQNFGLDGPHVLTYLTISSSNVRWTAKEKTREWRFAQPAASNLSSVTIYLGGPLWHQKNESRFVRADGKNVDNSDLPELLAEPTPILVSLSGKSPNESISKLLKPDTMILLLGSRDLELKPVVVESVEAGQEHAPKPTAKPVLNGNSSLPAR